MSRQTPQRGAAPPPAFTRPVRQSDTRLVSGLTQTGPNLILYSLFFCLLITVKTDMTVRYPILHTFMYFLNVLKENA